MAYRPLALRLTFVVSTVHAMVCGYLGAYATALGLLQLANAGVMLVSYLGNHMSAYIETGPEDEAPGEEGGKQHTGTGLEDRAQRPVNIVPRKGQQSG